ncbi:MAG TPA: hypothetical protein VMS38_14290 [Pseudorhodoferax sp.]|nr:hypothetical protein [Pseudorhodoferax sp.]
MTRAGWRGHGQRWLLCLALPAAAAGALYVYEQPRVRRPVRLEAEAVSPAPPTVHWSLEAPLVQAGNLVLQGTVLDERERGRWLNPTVLLLAADGGGMAYRTNLRHRADPVSVTPAERETLFSAFALQLTPAQLPAQRPLRIVLGVPTAQGLSWIDTGRVLEGAP